MLINNIYFMLRWVKNKGIISMKKILDICLKVILKGGLVSLFCVMVCFVSW